MHDKQLLETLLNDPDRLRKLRSLGLLDTPAEPAFDRLTRLACQMLDAPISLVTIVDVDRQFFKSQIGLPEPWATARETPLSLSICQHQLAQGAPLLIYDGPQDAFFTNHRAVLELDVKAYAGMPLVTSDGIALGSFCVIDHKPRRWTETEIAILGDLAASVITEIELRNELLERRAVEAALRSSEAQYRQILDAIQDLVLVKGRHSRIIWANRAFREYYGMSQEELEGVIDAPFVTEDQTEQYVIDDALVFNTGQVLDIPEEPVTRHDGLIRMFNTVKTPIFNDQGEVVMTVGVSRDVTDRKRQDAELRRALAKEIEMNELRARFASMASHEFRTPLAIILSSKGMLERYGDRYSPEKIQEHLNQIQNQVDRLSELVDDILALSKAETSLLALKIEPVDLLALCHQTIAEAQSITSQHNFDFSVVGDSALVLLDPMLLRQALTNLLSNAVKYSPDGGVVQVCLMYESDRVRVRIQDQGIGIPAEDVQQLFGAFHRAGNVGSIAGTGLGLAIVKRAVEAHGGTVEAESTIGAGTAFTLTLPFSRPTQFLEFSPD